MRFDSVVALPSQAEINGITVKKPPTGLDALRPIAMTRICLDTPFSLTA